MILLVNRTLSFEKAQISLGLQSKISVSGKNALKANNTMSC